MIFTASQLTVSFKDNNQIGLSHRTRVCLQGKCITHPSDLSKFTKREAWAQIVENHIHHPQVAGAQQGQLVN